MATQVSEPPRLFGSPPFQMVKAPLIACPLGACGVQNGSGCSTSPPDHANAFSVVFHEAPTLLERQRAHQKSYRSNESAPESSVRFAD